MTKEEALIWLENEFKPLTKRASEARMTILSSESQEMEKMKDENISLKNRCFIFSQGMLCVFCKMECKHRGNSVPFEVENDNS